MLSILEVSKTYGARTILKNVSLTIAPGTITLLTGNNGSGKTTLLKIMAYLVKPTKGTITSSCKPGNIGYLGHTTFIYPQLSAIENLKFWGSIHHLSITKKDLKKILERVNLLPFAYEPAGTFSCGMSQRLNLARVLLIKPQLLLLDEPSTGLDKQSIILLHKEILKAKTHGAGIVWITHNITQDLPNAEQLIILNNKTVEYCGPTTNYNDNSYYKTTSPC